MSFGSRGLVAVGVFIIGTCWSRVATAGEEGIVTGVYGRLTLAYDSAKHTLSGYIDLSKKDDEETKPCNLLFVGIHNGELQTNVQFYHNFTDSQSMGSGTLTLNEDETISLKFKNKPEPCGKPLPLTIDTVYKLSVKGEFSVIAVVKKEKQFLYEQPNFDAKLKSYVEKGDPVAVLKNKHNWILVKTLRNQNNYKWIPKNCLY
jgi:hypothetical protein